MNQTYCNARFENDLVFDNTIVTSTKAFNEMFHEQINDTYKIYIPMISYVTIWAAIKSAKMRKNTYFLIYFNF